jgi:hypothetical protein
MSMRIQKSPPDRRINQSEIFRTPCEPAHTMISGRWGIYGRWCHFDREGAMRRVWFGLAFAAVIANPAPAQDYRRNFVECAKELGLYPDTGYTHKLQDGKTLRRWYFRSEAQSAVFNDCVARKASLAPKPAAKGNASR